MVLVYNKIAEKYIKIGGKVDNQILDKICVMNRDNGKKFVRWDRLDAIAEILVVVSSASKVSDRWHFVPSDVGNIPDYISDKNCIYIEAQADESWEYDEWNLECFSLCLPVSGDMHSNKGVWVLCENYENYRIVLETIVTSLNKYM